MNKPIISTHSTLLPSAHGWRLTYYDAGGDPVASFWATNMVPSLWPRPTWLAPRPFHPGRKGGMVRPCPIPPDTVVAEASHC